MGGHREQIIRSRLGGHQEQIIRSILGGHQEQIGGTGHTSMTLSIGGIASAMLAWMPAHCGVGLLVLMNYVVSTKYWILPYLL